MADPTYIVSEGTGATVVAETPSSLGQRTVDLSDKMTLMNEALVMTGNTPVGPGDEQADEFITASMAFDQEADLLRYRRTWKFATRIVGLLRKADSTLPGYADIYRKPSDCLYLENVYRTDLAPLVYASQIPSMPQSDVRPPQLDYRIYGDDIHCTAPNGASATYIAFMNGSEPWSIGFRAVLRMKMAAFICRALNEDNSAADTFERMAEAALAEAAARSDSETPRRAAFRSGMREARKRRGLGYWP